jgi:exodeoxyribonuclease-3
MERIEDAGIAYDIRGMEKPSDHCPIWVDLNI